MPGGKHDRPFPVPGTAVDTDQGMSPNGFRVALQQLQFFSAFRRSRRTRRIDCPETKTDRLAPSVSGHWLRRITGQRADPESRFSVGIGEGHYHHLSIGRYSDTLALNQSAAGRKIDRYPQHRLRRRMSQKKASQNSRLPLASSSAPRQQLSANARCDRGGGSGL